MIDQKKRIGISILGAIVFLLGGSISTSYAQSPVDFRGTWNTVTGKGKKIVIAMETVRRTSVTGNYARNGLTAGHHHQESPGNAFVKISALRGEPGLQNISSIRGTVTGNVLRFKWFEDGGHGSGRFTMSSDGESFEGTFSMTDNPDDTSGGTWNGRRAPVFHGVWQTAAFPDLLLQQTGNLVVGRLSVNRPDLGMIRDGVIDGDTLRFKIWRARTTIPNALPDQYIGNGELVMEKGSKSFRGTILNAAMTGTRISPISR